MMAINLRDLAVLSIKDPASAARILLELSPPREALWTGLLLTAVLNTMMLVLSNMILPGPSPMPEVFNVPSIYLIAVAVGLVLISYSIFWTGRAMGGQGSIDDVMLLIVWLQALQVAVRALVLVLVLTIPFLAMLLVLASVFYGIWILIHFVDQAHRFGSLGRSAVAMFVAFVGLVLVLSSILAFLGVGLVESPGYV
ncbi:Yip1 family protein [Thalassococcus sp. S3]|uniref:Yip1 family protein n=1 Tax=Thalassococcus sp. S3 TaxID=2017482 RepID=UPI0010244BE6|nr:Yip1 family protein [Thalassococcus sp. S3]QBF31810.1 YIP1 family protein [Thalassococcus sp. S3]